MHNCVNGITFTNLMSRLHLIVILSLEPVYTGRRHTLGGNYSKKHRFWGSFPEGKSHIRTPRELPSEGSLGARHRQLSMLPGGPGPKAVASNPFSHSVA